MVASVIAISLLHNDLKDTSEALENANEVIDYHQKALKSHKDALEVHGKVIKMHDDALGIMFDHFSNTQV